MAKLTKKDFLAELAELSATFRRQIEAECDAFPVDAEASRQRRTKAQQDFAYFRRTYFPHYMTSYIRTRKAAEDGGQPRSGSAATTALAASDSECRTGRATERHHKVEPTGDSLLHTYLDDALPAAVDAPEGVKIATAAPRGEAKSTFVNLFFLLWCIVTGRKRYPLLIADALEQAAAQLEALKVELESNPRLRADWPEHCGQGRVWNVGTIVTAANVKIQAFGAGKRMRGLRHGPHRPDLALLDDLENDENVRKPEQRDKLQQWLQSTVLSLGPADDSMDVVYIGTILHYDSVLARTLKKPQWRARTFRAVVQWPEHMDLWDTWESILTRSGGASIRGEASSTARADSAICSLPLASADGFSGGPDAALAFYHANRAAMNAGAQVSWPTFRPLYKLMCKRAEDRAAFDSEQQNDPLHGDGAPFAQCITLWTELPSPLLHFGACDPSMGKQGAGRDPSALVVGGLHRDTMRLFVLEADIKKRHPDRIIQDIITLQRRYSCLLWGVEAVQFQAFFADVLVQEALRQALPMPVQPIINSTDKQLRIESLQPYCTQGRILFHRDQHTLMDQLRHFPMADHDDGPDALEMLWRIATQGFVSLQDAFQRVARPSFFGGSVGAGEDDTPESWN